jgi:adenosylcobinamide-GDP ribazoletransferase
VPLRLEADDVARGAVFFPVVGAGIGAVVGVIAGVDSLTAPLAAFLGLAAGALLTGALHLDALADTADALGAHTRERALEIMRDHRIGAYGAVALVLDLGAKATALAALGDDVLRIAVCAAATARVAPMFLAAALPYARDDTSTGSALGTSGWVRAIVAAAIAAGFCVWLDAEIVLAAVAGVALVMGVFAWRWLGGVTGDVLGATTELAELAALVCSVASVA